MEEPPPRWGHFSAVVHEKLCVWGGQAADLRKRKRYLHSFDPFLESWAENKCSGVAPPGHFLGAYASAGHLLCVYGGLDESKNIHSSLHQLDTRSWTWKQLSSAGPMKKIGCRMVTYGSKLVLFGGYGSPSGSTQPGAEFTKVDFTHGLTNELHTYDLKEGIWSSPAVSGTRPPPSSAFSLTMIDDHRAVLFGGKQSSGLKDTNYMYMLDLTRMFWTKLDHHEGEPCPVRRSVHAAVCLDYGGDHPQLLVIGGRDSGDNVLNDAWMLDVQSGRWRKVYIPNLQSRCYHRAAAFTLSPGLIEVTIFGGCTEWPEKTHIANTTVLQFESRQCPSTGGPLTRVWFLTDTADSTQLGTKERVRAKIKKIQATCTGEGRAREAESRATEAECRAREAERAKELSENRRQESEEKLQRLETQWVVERSEIQLIDQEIGRGAWATVSVAMFRGACVAAKCVHNQIVSPHNIRMFKREMDMAARIRHPNLLLFIGATVEGEMVILTELMPTSLRKELQRDYLSVRPAISISLDVLRALNYLHLMRPQPLVHRDISSANILLEPLPNGHWRAKVSDYGTVNLQENLATVGPGSPCYAAPEANDPTQQSPKMDIFSFGALLMEMLTGELPASDERARLMCIIHHQPLLALVQRCLKERSQDRPNASDIISELDTHTH